MYNSDYGKDVEFVIGGTSSILAHKPVIKLKCAALFDLVENKRKVELEDADKVSAFKAFVKYLYLGTIDGNVDFQLNVDLFELALKYKMPCLKSKSQELICQGINKNNVFDYLIKCHTEREKYEFAKEAVNLFVIANFSHIVGGNRWSEISIQHSELAIEILLLNKRSAKTEMNGE